MQNAELVKDLGECPMIILQKREALLQATQRLEDAKEALAKKETELLTSGAIDGKNAEIRKAQMREATELEQQAIKAAEARVEEAKLNLYYAEDRFQALRSIALIFAKEVSTVG